MGIVTVHFVGVCTHFRNTVPGIPHRVVLPDASALRFGITVMGDEVTPDHATYYLMPHFSVLRIGDRAVQEKFKIDGVMKNGNIFSGVRLAIPNAIGETMSYDASFDNVTRLTNFMEHYAFSPEVVLGGLAGVYFDLFSATMTAFPNDFQAVDAHATIETVGAPELLATPFVGGAPIRIALSDDPDAEVDLYVANQGMDCESPEASFDYLLHYLTNRNGIPRRLIQAVPGMSSNPTPFTHAELIEGADALKAFDFPANFNVPCLQIAGLTFLHRAYVPGEGFLLTTKSGVQVLIVSVACSNSQYP